MLLVQYHHHELGVLCHSLEQSFTYYVAQMEAYCSTTFIFSIQVYHHVVYTTDCTKLRTCGVHQMLLVINHKAAIAIVRLCWQQIFTCMVDLVTESFSRFPTYMCFLHRITLGQQQSFLDKHLLLVTGKSIQLFSLNLLVIAPILWARTCLCLVAA